MSFSPVALAALLCAAPAWAEQESAPVEGPRASLFAHPEDTPWWLSGQINIITQYHPPFTASYSGANSLRPVSEAATSYVATVYSGVRVTPTTELLLDLESAAGGGVSDALGVAGFTNLDVVRNPSLSSVPYVARAMVRQVIPLSAEWIDAPHGLLGLATRLPQRRLELRAGKISTVDFFDLNSVGSDSHLQFTNWSICNNGAYDYAADTRGYAPGVVAEFQDASWGVRLGEMMMPTVANGIDYDLDLLHARGENLEVEVRHHVLFGHRGVVRLLGYLNHARMGRYAEAVEAARFAADQPPDITAHRHRGAIKAGVGVNLEQELTDDLRLFLRLGWSDGRNESFAYTEIDDTAVGGFDLRGGRWRRSQDKLGFAVATNGISKDHREYLAAGGLGFLLGDGSLRYGRETTVEAYYTALLLRGVTVAGDVQGLLNPGYNQDRGPVLVLSMRVHLEF